MFDATELGKILACLEKQAAIPGAGRVAGLAGKALKSPLGKKILRWGAVPAVGGLWAGQDLYRSQNRTPEDLSRLRHKWVFGEAERLMHKNPEATRAEIDAKANRPNFSELLTSPFFSARQLRDPNIASYKHPLPETEHRPVAGPVKKKTLPDSGGEVERTVPTEGVTRSRSTHETRYMQGMLRREKAKAEAAMQQATPDAREFAGRTQKQLTKGTGYQYKPEPPKAKGWFGGKEEAPPPPPPSISRAKQVFREQSGAFGPQLAKTKRLFEHVGLDPNVLDKNIARPDLAEAEQMGQRLGQMSTGVRMAPERPPTPSASPEEILGQQMGQVLESSGLAGLSLWVDNQLATRELQLDTTGGMAYPDKAGQRLTREIAILRRLKEQLNPSEPEEPETQKDNSYLIRTKLPDARPRGGKPRSDMDRRMDMRAASRLRNSYNWSGR